MKLKNYESYEICRLLSSKTLKGNGQYMGGFLDIGQFNTQQGYKKG